MNSAEGASVDLHATSVTGTTCVLAFIFTSLLILFSLWECPDFHNFGYRFNSHFIFILLVTGILL